MKKAIYLTTVLILLFLIFRKPDVLNKSVTGLTEKFAEYWKALTQNETSK